MAKAIDVTQLLPADPVTVVLSEKGWVRAAKGHDVDARMQRLLEELVPAAFASTPV